MGISWNFVTIIERIIIFSLCITLPMMARVILHNHLSPTIIEFSVTDASVINFNLTNDSLDYNFSLNITVKNPNLYSEVVDDYSSMAAIAYYKDMLVGGVRLPPFSRWQKKTAHLNALFEGKQDLWLKNKALAEYYSETYAGAYHMTVEIVLYKIMTARNAWEDSMHEPKISCRVKIPVVSAEDGKQGSGKFSITRCNDILERFS